LKSIEAFIYLALDAIPLFFAHSNYQADYSNQKHSLKGMVVMSNSKHSFKLSALLGSILMLCIISLSTSNADAQTGYSSAQFDGTAYGTAQYFSKTQKKTLYTATSLQNIGADNSRPVAVDDSELTDIYRTMYNFSLSNTGIDPNYITSITLHVSFLQNVENTQSSSANISQMSATEPIGGQSDGSMWKHIGEGTSYWSTVKYGGTNPSGYDETSAAFTSAVKSAMQSPFGILNVGMYCTEEGKNMDAASVRLSITIKYNALVDLTVGNSFSGGYLIVDQQQYYDADGTGIPFSWRQGTQHTITAIDNQTDPYGTTWSYDNWKDRSGNPLVSSPQLSYGPFTVTASNTYTANFSQMVTLSLSTASFPEGGGSGGYYTIDGQQTSSLQFKANQSHTIQAYPPNGWSFWKWSDGNTSNPRSITPRYSMSLNAVYKSIHKSNDASAFSNNAQRRLIETSAGGTTWLHQVYTSMNHVWIEHSSNGGSSWTVGNNGQPLDGTAGGKNPAIAFGSYASWGRNYIGVVWQQQYGSTYTIQGKIFNQASNGSIDPTGSSTLYTEPSDGYNSNANPNIVLMDGFYSNYLLTFERKSTSGSYQPGINWLVNTCESYGGGQEEAFPSANPPGYVGQLGVISGTNASSTDAQMSIEPAVEGMSNTIAVILIRQQGSPGTIYSHELYLDEYSGVWYYSQADLGMISYNSNINFSPSVVSLPNYYYDASWIEYDEVVFYYSGEQVRHYYTSGGVQSCSINRGGGSSNSGFVGWSKYWGGTWSNQSMRFDNGYPNSGTMQTLGTSGKYVQVANGVNQNLSGMRISSFYPFTSPYSFSTSSLGPLPKGSPQFVEGRGFSIDKGDASFTYRLDNLNVDGKDIAFVDVPDTCDYGKINVLNAALLTEPFQLKNNSKVVFTERSGFPDSTEAVNALGKDSYVKYKVEMIDAATGKVLGTIRDVSLTLSNPYSLKTPSYLLNVKGLANKTVRIRISLATNMVENMPIRVIGPDSSKADSSQLPIAIRMAGHNAPHSNLLLVKSHAEQNTAMTAASLNNLVMQELDVPTTYALGQNYPNPFNPSTIINYQIPNDGQVTLKVYDVLGREVKTLVNEFKQVGRYSVTLDASSLATGVYFYRITSGNYVSTKKMLLMK
jgi:hypothetical protein